MPTYVKWIITGLAVVAGVTVIWWQADTGNTGAAVAAAVAMAVGCIGVWIFPEASAAKKLKRR